MKKVLTGIVALVLIFIVIPFGIMTWMSLAWVHDPERAVNAAYIEDGWGRHRMHSIGRGWHVFLVESDGHFVVECKSVGTFEGGYVTSHGGETLTVDADCKAA